MIDWVDTYGVVKGRVHLRGDDSFDEVQSVDDHTVHLRDAAHCVGILNSGTVYVVLWRRGRMEGERGRKEGEMEERREGKREGRREGWREGKEKHIDLTSNS